MFQQALFYVFSTILIASAAAVITVRNPVHSVLFLVLCFLVSAGLWILLQAEFLAIILILVYVGAVMVLFLFVVMMLDINLSVLREGFAKYLPLGVGVTLLIIIELAMVLNQAQFLGSENLQPVVMAGDVGNTQVLGAKLYTDYIYPFEIAAIILFVAIVAAITLTMRKRDGRRLVDPADQVKVKAADRVRIIKMAAEKKE